MCIRDRHASFAGAGKPAHVEACPAPDTYRGPHRGADAGAKYAARVEEVSGRPPGTGTAAVSEAGSNAPPPRGLTGRSSGFER
eukprot:3365965-Prymnesium_polylepis.1